MGNIGIILFTVVAGAGLALQAAMNAKLAKYIQQPVLAGIVSFLVGLSALLLFGATGIMGRIKVTGIDSVPWWAYIGGLFGAVYVVAALLGVPKAGAATVLAAAVCGQIALGLLLDSLGWLGVDKVPLSGWRIGGAALLIVGTILMAKR